MGLHRTFFATLFIASAPAVSAADLELLMIEQPGCVYCARWDAEVAPEYPLTTEGKVAPLRRLQLSAPLPDGITLVTPPVFTPTFILLVDGIEQNRIEGYPGEDFFWPLLATMISSVKPNQ